MEPITLKQSRHWNVTQNGVTKRSILGFILYVYIFCFQALHEYFYITWEWVFLGTVVARAIICFKFYFILSHNLHSIRNSTKNYNRNNNISIGYMHCFQQYHPKDEFHPRSFIVSYPSIASVLPLYYFGYIFDFLWGHFYLFKTHFNNSGGQVGNLLQLLLPLDSRFMIV